MKHIIKSAFSEDCNKGKYCIRRIMGSIGFIACIVGLFSPNIDSAQFDTLLYVSTALLGSTTFDKFANKQ